MSGFLETTKRLVQEFWLPFLASICWTIFDLYSNSRQISVTEIVKVLGPSFFLASWATGQIIRVRRQSKVENSLTSIISRFAEVTDSIADESRRMIENITGGKSFAYIQIATNLGHADKCKMMLVHNGSHPIYNISIRIVDLEKFDSVMPNITYASMRQFETYHEVNILTPNHGLVLGDLDLGSSGSANYNIFYTARNGSYNQQLRMRKLDGIWRQATKVTGRFEGNDTDILLEDIPGEFDKLNPAVEWK